MAAADVLRDEDSTVVANADGSAVEGFVVEGAEGDAVVWGIGATGGVPLDVCGFDAEVGAIKLPVVTTDGSWDRHNGAGWSRIDGVPSAGDHGGPAVGGQPSTPPEGEEPILSGGNLEAHEPLPPLTGGSQPSAPPAKRPPTQTATGSQSGQSAPTGGQPYYGANTLGDDYIARTNGGQRVEHYNQGRSYGGGRGR